MFLYYAVVLLDVLAQEKGEAGRRVRARLPGSSEDRCQGHLRLLPCGFRISKYASLLCYAPCVAQPVSELCLLMLFDCSC